jgi:methionyl-tRNA synthetase
MPPIDKFAPWKKQAAERGEFLAKMNNQINLVGRQLVPFMPSTAEKIIAATQGKIKKILPLFPKKG